MTTLEDFEKWFADSYGIDISIDRAGEGYIYDQINDKWIGYQACAAHYEAKIALYEAVRLYDEAPDDAYFEPPHPIFQLAQERDNYADQVRNLIALIAEKDKALQFYANYDHMTKIKPWHESDNAAEERKKSGFVHVTTCNDDDEIWVENGTAAEKAISITHDSVRLVEVGSYSMNGTVSGVRKEPQMGTKLYTIVKGEAG